LIPIAFATEYFHFGVGHRFNCSSGGDYYINATSNATTIRVNSTCVIIDNSTLINGVYTCNTTGTHNISFITNITTTSSTPTTAVPPTTEGSTGGGNYNPPSPTTTTTTQYNFVEEIVEFLNDTLHNISWTSDLPIEMDVIPMNIRSDRFMEIIESTRNQPSYSTMIGVIIIFMAFLIGSVLSILGSKKIWRKKQWQTSENIV